MIGVFLVLAFIRGFSVGLWRSVFNLVGTGAAFLGAYFLSGPAVDLANSRLQLLEKVSGWWRGVFAALPPLAVPYDPSTFDQAFSSIGGSTWGSLLQGAIKQNLLAVGVLAGPNPTWAEMLSLALARLLLSSVAFLLLLSILRISGSGGLGFWPCSFTVRLLGAIVETGICCLAVDTGRCVLPASHGRLPEAPASKRQPHNAAILWQSIATLPLSSPVKL